MDYREEQLLNQQMVSDYFLRADEEEKSVIRGLCNDYLRFRADVGRFQDRYFQSLCSMACFQQQRSACCNKDGIITFFADLVINAVLSEAWELDTLIASLHHSRADMKCIYLGSSGCRWRLKPIVCEMFICDRAKEEVFATTPDTAGQWDRLKMREHLFRWPDRPVLFDEIESRFLAAGVRSSLMYLHNSPGLIRIKRKAGLT